MTREVTGATQPQEFYALYIGGRYVPASTGACVATLDPASEEPVAEVAEGSVEDADAAVAEARRAFAGPWRRLPPKARAQLLYDLSAALEARTEEFALLETLDSGKPLDRSRREVASTVRYFRFYAGAADKINGEQIPLGPHYLDFTVREPLGVTVHIVPWNMPLNMVGRSVAPALAAGNTVVVKPAEETPLTALALGRLFGEVGFPPGVYNVVTGAGPVVGAHLSRHRDVDAITFTGSVETGREVMRGAAEHIKPVALELGGKSPIIVLPDADLDLATREVVKAIYSNSGQFCNAGSRLIVHEAVRQPLLERVVTAASSLRIGPGMANPDLGPVVSERQHRQVLDYIALGSAEGEILTGGGRPAGLDRGWFVAPTVIVGLLPDARTAREEIFGPVLAVLSVGADEEAAAVANDSPYGLAAGVFTKDIDRALRLATEIRAGQLYINEYFAGGEETPFGGFKYSGFGREKGLEGLKHYTLTKNIAIRIH